MSTTAAPAESPAAPQEGGPDATGDQTPPAAPAPAPASDSPSPAEDGRVTRANREAAKYRQELRDLQAAQERQRDDLARALGLKPADADPAALAQQLTEARGREADMARQVAVLRHAAAAGVDPDAVMDSQRAMTALADMDVTDTKALTAALKNLAKEYPRLAATSPAPAGQSSQPTGGPTGTEPINRAQLSRMTPEQIVQARRDGRLTNLR